MTKSLYEILSNNLRKEKMVDFLKKNPHLFDETIKTSLIDENPQSWRAAWLVKHYMQKNDLTVKPRINSILKVLLKKKDGHQREFLNIMMEMNLSEKQEGVLFDKCIIIWKDVAKSSSVRGVAFEILLRTARKYPELVTEIDYLSQTHMMETLSPGIKHSIKRKLQLLKSNKLT